MDRIGIIQLSDLQFGAKHVFGYPSTMARKLSYDVQRMAEKFRFTPVYLVVSGDITETAARDEFDDAHLQMEALRQELYIDDSAVLYVPGNHDICWKLSDVGEEISDSGLKYRNFYLFEHKYKKAESFEFADYYPCHTDHRFGMVFVLLNSCEKESSKYHQGYVDPDKLIETVRTFDQPDYENYCRVCVLHHRIDLNAPEDSSYLENASEINSILKSNKFNLVLSGHVHQNMVHEVNQDDHKVIYAGTGSTAVNQSQREDGIQNQYCIHVIDTRAKCFESHWRAYNPNSATKYGKGGWVIDNTYESNPITFQLPAVKEVFTVKEDMLLDAKLVTKLGVRSNPFTFSNAEKINNSSLVIDLFVENESRHQSALRMVGDAIIRGRRGSGKTMLLRYLNILGSVQFDSAIRSQKAAESLPVMINLSRIHSAEWKTTVNKVVNAADKLIYDSVFEAIEEKRNQLNLPSFDRAFHDLKQRLQILGNQEGSLISKMGNAVKKTFDHFFNHILLLIDEVAPVFPSEFFSNPETGFVGWMNSIRNSGPYTTRIAVYPNDVADVLNEDRFGSVVNLDYSVRTDEDYLAFKAYCIRLIDKYLKTVSIDSSHPLKVGDIISVCDETKDPLEQLIYTSDGSSRRFLSLIDKCLMKLAGKSSPKGNPLDKSDILEVINDFAGNLLVGYNTSSQELAKSIAKACKKQVTFRFRFPGYSTVLSNLYASREELNIVKIVESGTGQRGTTYEFTYPYCVYMEIQTHYLKDSRKVCAQRDRLTGEWISTITTIQRGHLDFFQTEERKSGKITEVDGITSIIDCKGTDYLCDETPEGIVVGNEISFLVSESEAYDLIKV